MGCLPLWEPTESPLRAIDGNTDQRCRTGALKNTVNSVFAAEQGQSTVFSLGKADAVAEAIQTFNYSRFRWLAHITDYFPTVRVDYNATQKIRFGLLEHDAI